MHNKAEQCCRFFSRCSERNAYKRSPVIFDRVSFTPGEDRHHTSATDKRLEQVKAAQQQLPPIKTGANGGGHTGWSKAWIINFYARLQDGEQCGEQVQSLLQKSTLPSLLSTHPPFQIDGNFGGAAGIAEMLLQSQNNEIHVLPALPSSWPNGSIKGLRARGGYTINMSWRSGKLTRLIITTDRTGSHTIRYGDKAWQVQLKKGDNTVTL